MALTVEEEIRIQAIEKKLNTLQNAMNKLITRDETIKLTLIRQREIIDLQNEVTSLKSMVAVLENA